MKYELHILKSLIEKYCYEKIEVSFEEYEILKKDIETEGFRIKDALIDNYFAINNKYQLKKYIRRHQIGIIRLLDSVFLKLNQSELSDINTIKNSNPELNIKNLLYLKLESLLSFIESYFSTYFNQEDMIPKRYQYIAKNEFTRKLKSVNNFTEQKANCSVIELATTPLNEFINSKNKISFRQLIYIKKTFQGNYKNLQ